MADETNSQEERSTFTSLARQLGKLSGEKKRAALEMSAALAGVSLRVSREFVEAVPNAAKVLSADDLRLWGELGRKLAMGSADVGVAFFSQGVDGLKDVPAKVRSAVFQICSRQLVLSSSIALETFRLVPTLVNEINDRKFLADVLTLAAEISLRSAKHSSEFLHRTSEVGIALSRFEDKADEVAEAVIALAAVFANKTGGMTADLWSNLPKTLEKIDARNAVLLMKQSADFLEFGGSVTLHFVSAGGEALAAAPAAFDDWSIVARKVARHGNAVLISFLRSTPKFFGSFDRKKKRGSAKDICLVLRLTAKIAETDAESALAAFRSSASALKEVSIEQFEQWVATGISEHDPVSAKARRSYFALETRGSKGRLHETRLGLPLEKVQSVLRLYVEALTGKEIEVAPITEMPHQTRIGDGRTIYLPVSVAEFDDDEMDFRLYKVLAAYGAGQIEFGTFETDTAGLKAAFADLTDLYEATADQIDAFSLAGYIEDVQKGDRALTDKEAKKETKRPKKRLPKNSDYRAVLTAFPEPRLARKIFGTLENARIDSRLRHTYRGLRHDLDLMRSFLNKNRPYIFDLPMHQVPFELLFQITVCGGATDDARQFYGQIVSEIETVIQSYLEKIDSTVADTLMATSRVYMLFQNISPEQTLEAESDKTEESGDFAYEDKESAESVTEDKVKREQQKNSQDISDLFNAWNSLDEEGEPDDLQGSEAWSQSDLPEQPLEADDVAFAYDEWDRELNDYRVGWSRVIEG